MPKVVLDQPHAPLPAIGVGLHRIQLGEILLLALRIFRKKTRGFAGGPLGDGSAQSGVASGPVDGATVIPGGSTSPPAPCEPWSALGAKPQH